MADGRTLTKDILSEEIREKIGLSAQASKQVLELLLEAIKSELERGNEVKISGFGKWTVREKRSRPGRNPHSGDKIEICARRVVTFHPSDILRERVDQESK